ncbi:MAG TPA: ATP-grasp domain-containing protein [Rhizobiaceae bacterium]|nr:ATP-grasp domain-containing protein [Rhizobiaceae bacterium]
MGGAHGSLALARSIGALGVPVWLVSDDSALPGWSRHVHGALSWAGADEDGALDFLLDAAYRHGLQDHLLVPAGDAEVRLVSQSRRELSEFYRIMLPEWEALRWVCEKPLLYQRAKELDIAFPRTYRIASLERAAELKLTFPVILKPHMGGGDTHFVKAKVIRADDQSSFLAAYGAAVAEVGPENVVVQEMIPGGGESQFSYAALWHEGAPVAEFTARRTRQYPIDFGYTSTFVEVMDEPEAKAGARLLLASIAHSGLVEIEFKRDKRDGTLKLLDVNPRPWSWFALCRAAGLDLGAMLWTLAAGGKVQSQSARSKASWMYLARDATAAAKLVRDGRLSISEYLRSFATVRSWATFSMRDPVPGLVDLPLTAWRVLTRRVFKIGRDHRIGGR